MTDWRAVRRLGPEVLGELVRRYGRRCHPHAAPARQWRAVPRPRSPWPTGDDTLTLLFLCCHPALTPPSQVALTLRAVGGLSAAEIARAFLVPEATMAQRISRAKHSIGWSPATARWPGSWAFCC